MKKIFVLLLAGSLSLACNQTPASQEEAVGQEEPGHTHGPGENHQHEGEILEAKVIGATEFAPEYIQHATNVEIIEDVKEALQSPSAIFTHEGYFGPLLFGEEIRAFYIRLEPGMFLAEHPHPTESLVYTMSGRWVLCSEGKRQVMEAGSVFHFGSNAPTGWEAPFPEGAFLFIVKKMGEGEGYEPYTKDIRNLAEQLDNEKKSGSIFYYDQLESDHLAILFAREHNPDFDEILSGLKKE
jgi:quercetin dioxygenase-like cupin family protein